MYNPVHVKCKGLGTVYNFLVLGYVPGTNIQLSFTAIVAVFTVLTGVSSIVMIELHRRRLLPYAKLRMPLHASSLHLRAV